jgi:multidrug efflux pump subunit AcrA (membrane-fusion protein)
MVYIASVDNKAHAQNITVGFMSNTQAEVTSGLNPGDSLIVKGQGEIQDGDPISIATQRKHGSGNGSGGQSQAPPSQ